jgi:hypothetical protein
MLRRSFKYLVVTADKLLVGFGVMHGDACAFDPANINLFKIAPSGHAEAHTVIVLSRSISL